MVQQLRGPKSGLVHSTIHTVTMEHPWKWLEAGWRDITKTPISSILYGLIFVVMGYNITAMLGTEFHMALTLATGFLLVGPFVAIGLYELSRRTEENMPNGLGYALTAWRGNTVAVLFFGAILGILMVTWGRLASLIYALTIAGVGTSLSENPEMLFFSGDGLTFLVVFTLVGAVLAVLVFSISVVSIPMLLDRRCDFLTAVATSLVAVQKNPLPMVLWAFIIVAFSALGLVTWYIGLAVTMPLIGHATWHAYKDLVA